MNEFSRRHADRWMAVVIVLSVLGCSYSCGDSRTFAEIESSTSWSCKCGNRTIDDSGNQKVNLIGQKCASVKKQTREGFLTVRIGSHSETTTAEFGELVVCDPNSFGF